MALTHSQQRQITSRYALAGFDIAQSAKEAPQALEALFAIKEAIAQNADLALAIENPLLSKTSLNNVFEAILNQVKAPASALSLVKTMIDNGRAHLLGQLAEAFQERHDNVQGIMRGELISAQPLDAAAVDAIAKSLSNKTRTVKLSARSDASLIGGLRLRFGSQMIDASVAGSLSRLKQHLNQPVSPETTA